MSTETRITDPTTGGQKGRKAERYDLLPYEALDVLARVYGFGAEKYADHNWRKGYAWSLSLGALLRHVAKFAQGEDLDPESGEDHLAHAAFHCLTLITFRRLGLGRDDRAVRPLVPPEAATYTLEIPAADVLEAFAAKVVEFCEEDTVRRNCRPAEEKAPVSIPPVGTRVRITAFGWEGRTGVVDQVDLADAQLNVHVALDEVREDWEANGAWFDSEELLEVLL